MDIAVITTLNEAESIGWLVQGLREHDMRVCVVDDASEDDTAYLAGHAGAHVIYHPLRRGIGPCLVAGWRWALSEGATAVVQLDAGRSHFPIDAPALLGRLAGGGVARSGDRPQQAGVARSGDRPQQGGVADVVVGSRFRPGARYHGGLKRQALSRAAALACNVRYGHAITGVSDWTSGYRAFSGPALRKLARCNYRATMHGWQIEVLLAARWLDMTVVEAPITYRAGRSSFNRRVATEAFNVWRQSQFA